MAYRDEASDTSRDASGALGRDAVPTRLGRDYCAVTLEDEILAGGWTPQNSPWPPRTDRLSTAGGRGDPDLDDDSYGVTDEGV